MDLDSNIDPDGKRRMWTLKQRRTVAIQMLECMRLLDRAPGGLRGGQVLVAIFVGGMDDTPTSVSDVAAVCGLPRSSVRHYAKLLEEVGWIRIKKQGNRTVYISQYEHTPSSGRDAIDLMIKQIVESIFLDFPGLSEKSRQAIVAEYAGLGIGMQ